MRWDIQRKLQAIVFLTVATLIVLVLVDFGMVVETNRALDVIEGEYVPLIDLGPAVQDDFFGIGRDFQAAVAGEDPDAVTETRVEKERLIERLNHAPKMVSAVALRKLQHDIEDWYATGFGVSLRLIQGEKGEDIVHAIETLQAKQRAVEEEIGTTVFLDRAKLTAAFDRTKYAQVRAATIRSAIRTALTGLVIALAMAISHRLMRSLHGLADGFTRFGHQDFSTPIDASGTDEFSQIASNANRMASSLADLDEQVRKQQAELERTNRELEAFSYSVSHDLRAPLRGIDGFSQALVEDYGRQLPDEAKHYLARVRAAAQRMAELIDDLLNLSRVGRSLFVAAPVDFSALAHDVATEISQRHPDEHVNLRVAEGLSVRGDARLLRIVLENLLDNAWKFASRQPDPRVEIGLETVDDVRAFFVRDNGVGFDMSQAQRLFMPFQRLHTMAEFAGTGIGLATVQRIVHRHGGRVWAASAKGDGATFFLELPGIEASEPAMDRSMRRADDHSDAHHPSG